MRKFRSLLVKYTRTLTFLNKERTLFKYKDPLFEVQSVEKFVSAVRSLSFSIITLHAKRALWACSSHAKSIFSLLRMDVSYPYHLGVDSGVFKDSEFEIEAKTNSGPRVCPLFARFSLLLAYQVNTHVQ